MSVSVSREMALHFLRDHHRMIALNPLVTQHERCDPPSYATLEEATSCTWYSVTDKISYLPGAPLSNITYKIAFCDRPDGLQSHIHSPNGIDIRAYWKVGGSLPGEPAHLDDTDINIPKDRLYLRENVDLKCSVLIAPFVKKNIRRAHTLVFHSLIERCQQEEQRLAALAQAREPAKPDSPTVPSVQAYMIASEDQKRRSASTGTIASAKSEKPPPLWQLIHPALRSRSQTSLTTEPITPPLSPPLQRPDPPLPRSTIRAFQKEEYPFRPSDVYSPSEAACERGEHGPGCPHYFIATYGSIDWEPLEAITPVEERNSPDKWSPNRTSSKHSPSNSTSSKTSSPDTILNKPLPPILHREPLSEASSIYTAPSSILCFCEREVHDEACPVNKEQLERSITRFKKASTRSSESSGDSAVYLPPPDIPPRSALRPKFDPSTHHLKPKPLNVRRTWSVTLPETLRPRSPIPLRIVIPA